MSKVRLGIIGLGNMGATHARNILSGAIPELALAAVADTDPTRFAPFPEIPSFSTAEELITSGLIDAVLIATPHFSHTTYGIRALQAGFHVLVEKPVSVHKADVERLMAAHQNPKQIFGAVFNQRTDHYFIAIRNLIMNGDLGEIRRVNWIITNWFRTEYYYASGGWRATWAGEGGGVLLNQSPHNLDLFQWIFGLPTRVRAHCSFGRYHNIEVEDDVTAYFEFANGATGTFITSTGEAPGTNRLEITGEKGKVVYENDCIHFARNERPMTEFSRTVPEAFARPVTMETVVSAKDHGGQHVEILQNFAAAILHGTPLIARAEEGIHSVELANAMLMSAWTNEAVTLPLDAARYERLLKEEIATSRHIKTPMAVSGGSDFTNSFGR